MNIKDVQEFLRSLSRPLSTAGAKKAAEDLERMCAGLEPFQDLGVAQFADFLARADQYARTGVVPRAGPSRSSRPKTQAQTLDSSTMASAVEHLRSLYERVSSPEVTYSMLEAEVRRLDKQFGKDAVLEIAKGLGIGVPLRTKKAALEEIHRRLRERKETHERTQF